MKLQAQVGQTEFRIFMDHLFCVICFSCWKIPEGFRVFFMGRFRWLLRCHVRLLEGQQKILGFLKLEMLGCANWYWFWWFLMRHCQIVVVYHLASLQKNNFGTPTSCRSFSKQIFPWMFFIYLSLLLENLCQLLQGNLLGYVIFRYSPWSFSWLMVHIPSIQNPFIQWIG